MRNLLTPLLLAISLAFFSTAAHGTVYADDTPAATAPGTGVASATSATPPAERVETDPAGVASEVVEAVQGGQWRNVAAGVLALVMLGAGYLHKERKWSDREGALWVMGLAQLGAVSTALYGSEPLSIKLFLGAMFTAFSAVGAFTWIKRLIKPADSPA